MKTLAKFILLFALAVVSACASTRVNYTPYSATSAGLWKITDRAVVAYRGDIQTLVDAGAVEVGTFQVDGNGFASSQDVRDRAMNDAASLGGTHIIVGGEDTSTTWSKVTPDTATTTTFSPGLSIPVSRSSGFYTVVRVPMGKWHLLPPALRPEPQPQDVQVDAPGTKKDERAWQHSDPFEGGDP